MNTRVSLLLMALLWTSTLAQAQELATSTSATLASRYGTGQTPQKYRPISGVPVMDPRIFYTASGPRDQTLLWQVHLSLHLVKHPGLNESQVRLILDAISLSSPEFFTSNDRSAQRLKQIMLTNRRDDGRLVLSRTIRWLNSSLGY